MREKKKCVNGVELTEQKFADERNRVLFTVEKKIYNEGGYCFGGFLTVGFFTEYSDAYLCAVEYRGRARRSLLTARTVDIETGRKWISTSVLILCQLWYGSARACVRKTKTQGDSTK